MKTKITMLLLFVLCVCGCARAHSPNTAAQVKQTQNLKSLAQRIFFPFASYRVKKKDRATLVSNAQWMRQNPDVVIILEGHCDERGSREFNMELGDRRARSVMAEMMREGVDEDRLIVISKGELEPLDGRHIPKAWRKNRRVEFRNVIASPAPDGAGRLP
ncbi:MAG: OmpA family protein [Pseudomonadota bacterium]